MRIWGDNPKVFGIYSQQNPVGKTTAKDMVASRKDEYKISGQAKDFQTVIKALHNIPDIRQNIVQKISAKMEKGEYNVPANNISEKIINILSGNNE
jgi:negative regulator of flagellin synthesis FlgM